MKFTVTVLVAAIATLLSAQDAPVVTSLVDLTAPPSNATTKEPTTVATEDNSTEATTNTPESGQVAEEPETTLAATSPSTTSSNSTSAPETTSTNTTSGSEPDLIVDDESEGSTNTSVVVSTNSTLAPVENPEETSVPTTPLAPNTSPPSTSDEPPIIADTLSEDSNTTSTSDVSVSDDSTNATDTGINATDSSGGNSSNTTLTTNLFGSIDGSHTPTVAAISFAFGGVFGIAIFAAYQKIQSRKLPEERKRLLQV